MSIRESRPVNVTKEMVGAVVAGVPIGAAIAADRKQTTASRKSHRRPQRKRTLTDSCGRSWHTSRRIFHGHSASSAGLSYRVLRKDSSDEEKISDPNSGGGDAGDASVGGR